MTGTRTLLLAALSCVAATDAAAGTKVLSSWRDPEAGTARFQKVLVFCFAPHESQRQFGEATLARLMKKTKGVAAYTVIPPDDLKDREKVRALMARDGYDGAVVLRFVGSEQKISEKEAGYVPLHTGFWDNYSGAFTMVYDPGYVLMKQAIQMETQVYSMKEGRLIWSGVSETTSPKSADKLVEDVARTVGDVLRKQRLID